MSTLDLDGLIGSHPLGALAAFGLLRILTRQGGTPPRLRFVERDDWVAQIECDHDSVADLVGSLGNWARSDRDALLAWTTDDVRVLPEEYRGVLSRALLEPNDEPAEFLSALAADGATDNSKGLIKPTPFYMASG